MALQTDRPDQAKLQEVRHKVYIFRTARCQFGVGKIARMKTPARSTPSLIAIHRNEPGLPPGRHDGCLRTDTVGMITEGLIELRKLPDAAFDFVSQIRAVSWKNILFH